MEIKFDTTKINYRNNKEVMEFIKKVQSTDKNNSIDSILYNYYDKLTFLKIPTSIMEYSCIHNHLILPLYIYSASHCVHTDDDLVDTNISHITTMFNEIPDNRTQVHKKVAMTMFELMNDVEDETMEAVSNNKLHNGFSAPFVPYDSSMPTNFEEWKATFVPSIRYKTANLKYYFCNPKTDKSYRWVKLTYEELHYLIDSCVKINSCLKQVNNSVFITSPFDKRVEWNVVFSSTELINFYLYIKAKVMACANYSNAYNTDINMHETVKGIATALNIGEKTVTRYTNQLETLGMLKRINTDYYGPKVRSFDVSIKWMCSGLTIDY